jgi:hypothetical protein
MSARERNGLPDAHPTEVLRFVGISYADWDYFYWPTITVDAFSHPPAVFESHPCSALFHLYDTRLGVTRALRKDADDTVGGPSDEAV